MRRRLIAVSIAVTSMVALAFVIPLGLLVRDVARLETFDLQVMFRMAETRVTEFVGKPRVPGDFLEHAPVQNRILAGHAALEFLAPTDCAVHEQVEINHREFAVRDIQMCSSIRA